MSQQPVQARDNDVYFNQFDFTVPDQLIARYPLPIRSKSRLLHVSRSEQRIAHHHSFSDITALLQPHDLLVLNNTKVIPARLYAQKAQTGGKVEILIERILPSEHVLAHLKANRSIKPGTQLVILGSTHPISATVIARNDSLLADRGSTNGGLFRLRFDRGSDGEALPIARVLEEAGHIPLPPYLRREAEPLDKLRYQTVYAKHAGAVAAPTAGLHFDDALLATLRERGIETAYVTLHVGAGTFQPIRCEKVNEHTMHTEHVEVPQTTCDKLRATRAQGGRIVAVGTTTVRALEAAATTGTQAQASRCSLRMLQPFVGETDIFIYPGYAFQVVDAMITNFHLPKSTLIVLVCAFAGHALTMMAYRQAVLAKYRFFSYGDAMLIS